MQVQCREVWERIFKQLDGTRLEMASLTLLLYPTARFSPVLSFSLPGMDHFYIEGITDRDRFRFTKEEPLFLTNHTRKQKRI